MRTVIPTLILVILGTVGCTSPASAPAPAPLPPARLEDGTVLIVAPTKERRRESPAPGIAQVIAVDRRPIETYALHDDRSRTIPAGNRELTFRWSGNGRYAQAVARCELPTDRRLVLRWAVGKVLVDFWFEDAETNELVGRKYVGSLQIGNRPMLFIVN